MRDPLGNIPIAYKLPLGFLAVCLVVFGVGGTSLLTGSRRALEAEIEQRLDERASAVAIIVERHVDLLRQRARDFASDGFVRREFGAHSRAQHGHTTVLDSTSPLAVHFERNKLPLVKSVIGAVLYDTEGKRGLSVPHHVAGDETLASPAETAVGALRPATNGQAFPWFCVATPLFAQASPGRIGTLQLIVRADRWVQSLGELSSLPPMPISWMELVDPAGVSLPLLPKTAPRGDPSPSTHQRPLTTTGWQLHVDVDRDRAMAPATKLRRQYLWIGLGLLLATAAVLFFPLRFLLRPLRSVADAARRMSDGDFSVRVAHDGEDEIGELSNAFNVMASAVDERTRQLEAAADAVRKREQDVRIERDRLSAVIHSMEDGLLILNAEGRVTLANARARPLVRALEKAPIKRLECARETIAPAACLACLADLHHGHQSCVIEHGERIYDVHATALPAAPGRDGGRLCVSRDVTERIRQQESQAHQERMAVLGEVAAVMAHELNNPLAAISMFSEMMEEQLPSDSALYESASVIRRNVSACKRTIHALLDLAARGRPEHAPFDMEALIEDAAALLRPIHQRAGVTVNTTSRVEDASLVGDELRIRQVLVNLMMNAAQACNGRGAIDIEIADQGEHLVVDVKDSGGGIRPEHRERIFEPFFTTKGPGAGTGLGLSTSRRIVEEHGGTLACLDVKHGAVFRIRLPRKASQAAWEARARLHAEITP